MSKFRETHVAQPTQAYRAQTDALCNDGSVDRHGTGQRSMATPPLLARKPKLRMRTKPLGSRCSRKRRKNLAQFVPIGKFPSVIAVLGNPSADSSQES